MSLCRNVVHSTGKDLVSSARSEYEAVFSEQSQNLESILVDKFVRFVCKGKMLRASRAALVRRFVAVSWSRLQPQIVAAPAFGIGAMRQPMRFCAAKPEGEGNVSASGLAALEIAKRVNKMKRAHQSAPAGERKRIEKVAWRELNSLSENHITSAEGQAVALLLNSWAYFAKFWEKGKHGPRDPGEQTKAEDAEQPAE